MRSLESLFTGLASSKSLINEMSWFIETSWLKGGEWVFLDSNDVFEDPKQLDESIPIAELIISNCNYLLIK